MESRRVSKNIRFCQKKKIGLQLLATDKISHRSIREYFYKISAKVSLSEKMIKYIWDNYYNIKFNYISI